MPHNVYTGDDDGRVVRSSFLDLHKGEWISRKAGWPGQVEWRGGRQTKAVVLGGARTWTAEWQEGKHDVMRKREKREGKR
jgi:hypothetical protein